MLAVSATLQQAFGTDRAHLRERRMVTRQELGFVIFCSRTGRDYFSKTLYGNYDQILAEAFVCSRSPALQHATVQPALQYDLLPHMDSER
jgi:hypothetical protein